MKAMDRALGPNDACHYIHIKSYPPELTADCIVFLSCPSYTIHVSSLLQIKCVKPELGFPLASPPRFPAPSPNKYNNRQKSVQGIQSYLHASRNLDISTPQT